MEGTDVLRYHEKLKECGDLTYEPQEQAFADCI